MQYCGKCRRVCGDDSPRCPHCRGGKLRPVQGEDMVLLWEGDLYCCGLIEQALSQAGLEFKTQDTGGNYYGFECTELPTDRRIMVEFRSLEAAKALAVSAAKQAELERNGNGKNGENGEDGEDLGDGVDGGSPPPPGARRIAAEVISIAVFMLLVMLAVYGADAFAQWIKSLF